jgi:integrase
MPTVKMTDLSIQKLKAPPGERVEYFDMATAGLALRVSGPTPRNKAGKRPWVYYVRDNGRQRKLTLGVYPSCSLAAARAAANAVQTRKEQGLSPQGVRALAKAEAHATTTPRDTVAEVAALWVVRELEKRGRAAKYISGVRANLANHILPVIGDRDIASISRKDAVALLDGIYQGSASPTTTGKRGGPIAANRCLSIVRPLFAFAVERGLIEHSVVATMRRPGEEQRRDRVLSDAEIVMVMRAADATPDPYRTFVKLLLLLGQRRTEIARMRWRDIDLDAGTWTLPAALTKARREHCVPLVPMVVDLLRGLPRMAVCNADGHLVQSDWVLSISGQTPFAGLSGCKLRLDAAIVKLYGSPLKEWTYHDARRTAATGMSKLGTPPHVVSEVLNHARKGVTAQVYDQNDFAKERHAALQLWADHVAALLTPLSNVVALRTATLCG